MNKFSLSIFFPAYNEEANIEDSVHRAEESVSQLTEKYEIIIVDDGSKDKTGVIADDLHKKDPDHIKVVHHHPNQGYGAAVWSGIQAAKYDYVFFTDADLQFDLSELAKLTKYIPQAPVVIGYRAVRRDPLMRLWNAKSWNFLNRLLFGLKVKDIDCAFKLFRRDLVQKLPIQSRGAMMSAELLIRLQRQGIEFVEVPVSHLPRTAGSPTGAKPRVILRAFKEMAQVYRGDLGNITYKQIIKFATVGAINTVVDVGLYFIFTRFIPFFHEEERYPIANVTSYLTGAIFGFIMNRRWTFAKKGATSWGELTRYYITTAVGVAVNSLAFSFLLILVRVPDLWSKALATIISFAWNFSISKWWVFASKQKSKIDG